METSYFLFSLNQQLSAIKSDYVEEVFALPELILIPDAPLGIVGVIDLRGEVLPVLDLNLTVDELPRQYQLTDSVVVLNQAQLRIGIIVTAVHGLKDISAQAIEPGLFEQPTLINPAIRKLLAGVVTTDETIFVLSELQNWFNTGEIQQFISVTSFLVNEIHSGTRTDLLQSETAISDSSPSDSRMSFRPTASPEERMIFRQRAENLRRSPDEDLSSEGAKTLVVISLNKKLFGIDSQIVREFITVNQATPIPCCPTHIIGNMNLRGEILTVVDIGKSLNLALKDLSRTPKAIVAEFGNTTVGIVVDDIREAMFAVYPRDIQEVSDPDLAMKRSYVEGAVPSNDQMINILDLPTLLQSNDLVVNEIV